ncbi:tRNA1(Val) (adenine(37)-N6)-methyltransferase [Paraglaciecola aestuariivivens]
MGFRCKQFAIDDSQCAMKVGTDSLMLGSWVEPKEASKILDIGTGSGLLAIMLAQKAPSHAQITGIDIDKHAITQAKTNAANCPWSQKITFYQSDVQTWPLNQQYDLVISNPPYFAVNHSANQLSRNNKREHARQTSALKHGDLLKFVSQGLSPTGTFYCVLPADSAAAFCTLAEQCGLYLIKSLAIQARPDTAIIRMLLAFSWQSIKPIEQQITIYTQAQNYSPEYQALCKDFYLNF